MNSKNFADLDLYELGKMLKESGKCDSDKWRLFHCRCYRLVWRYIVAQPAKGAIEIAEQVATHVLKPEELGTVHDEMKNMVSIAWDHVYSLRDSQIEGAVWQESDTVDDAWCEYLSLSSAEMATRPSLDCLVIPDTSGPLKGWATARKGKYRYADHASIVVRWERIVLSEESHQKQLFSRMFGDVLKLPGAAGDDPSCKSS